MTIELVVGQNNRRFDLVILFHPMTPQQKTLIQNFILRKIDFSAGHVCQKNSERIDGEKTRS